MKKMLMILSLLSFSFGIFAQSIYVSPIKIQDTRGEDNCEDDISALWDGKIDLFFENGSRTEKNLCFEIYKRGVTDGQFDFNQIWKYLSVKVVISNYCLQAPTTPKGVSVFYRKGNNAVYRVKLAQFLPYCPHNATGKLTLIVDGQSIATIPFYQER